MLQSSSSPPRTRQRSGQNRAEQQYHQQQQQQEFYVPYKDDPNADPYLEAFTAGGLGPRHSRPDVDTKSKGWARQCCLGVMSGCRRCLSESPKSSSDEEVYYRDEFNDASWSCSVGTTDEHGIWMNRSDPAGTIMSVMVWVLIGYSALTMTFLALTGGIPPILSMLYCVFAALSLSSHAKTSLTDPGSVPASAVPTEAQRLENQKLNMCSQCQTFKPPFSHHCRICNRCISRMDHHCPWMNNCVGAGNMKHFLLFLIYTWICSVFSLVLLGWNYFFCATEECTFTIWLTQLVRVMTLLSIGSFLFTSSMLMNVCYGLMTGIGTIDRLKKKATGKLADSEEESIPLKDVFGIGPYYTWPFPTDPIFEDYDKTMGYTTPQRLLREQLKFEDMDGTGSAVGMNV